MKTTKQNVSNAVNDLINSGDADNEPSELSSQKIEIKDLWEEYKDTFDDHVVHAIERITTKNLVHQYNEPTKEVELANLISTMTKVGLNDELTHLPVKTFTVLRNYYPRPFDGLDDKCEYVRKAALVRYLGARVEDESEIEINVKKIHGYIKFFVDEGYIMGNLLKLCYIPFAFGGGAVVSYLIFTEEGREYLENNKLPVVIEEGQVPNKLED